ncbi:protein TIFY 5A-like [Vicia villosa]|uniref:protein TIFY 5A-like n=1 Tax=Vicia villosa TaxID=3911 RepID=UPI00273C1431|nr:protein TIFY 5A-like [Vicia villosa]
MKRNCNLELCLYPPYTFEEEKDSDKSSMQNEQQPLTIFYDGKMCVIMSTISSKKSIYSLTNNNNNWVNVNVVQAKSVLTMANKKVEEIVKTPTGSEPSTPTTVESPHQLYSPGHALSMKMSLQRFLQKRKNRIQQASPYNH